MNTKHKWRFFRAGGFDQVKIETGADVANLNELDQKLWVALACPTTGLEFDAQTLALIDTDKDGRVRASELLAAVKWAVGCLKNPNDLVNPARELPLSSINDATAEGQQLVKSARQILNDLGKKDATSISIDDTTDTARIFAQTNFNGDGIVPADAGAEDATKAVINDIIACLGAEKDRSGKPGISQAKADQFFAEAQAYSDWCKKAETDPAVLPLKDATAAAAAAFRAIKAKVDDYFARCRLASFDARAVAALNREEKEYLAIAAKDLTISSAEIASLPLAQVGADKPLPLKEKVNPAWAGALASLESTVVQPLLNKTGSLTEAEWAALSAKFAAFEAWMGAKAGGSVEKLGVNRVRDILGSKAKEAIAALIAKDKALEPEAAAISSLDKLVRYRRDLFLLLNNFVSFKDFYDGGEKAIFQAGTLYLDQRSCDLCLYVEDAGKHGTMAGLAGSYLAYCDIARKGSGEKKQIVAAFTNGDSDNLMVGRNGVFYDRKGRDWDATITKIVDNPISIRQAFWAPYKKLVRMVEEQVAKRAAAAEAASTDKLQVMATQAATLDQAKDKPAAPKKVDVGVVAALGVAVGAIGGALASLATGLMKLAVWQIPLVVIGAILMVSLPSMIIAWLKLRKRNLGPLMDANGWAVNARARINVPFGASLTGIAKLPPGAQRDMRDPFADKSSPWPKIIVVVIVLWIAYALLDKRGLIHKWTDGWVGKPVPAAVVPAGTSPSTNAPAAETPKA